MNTRFKEYYMDLALRTAANSRATRLQVGCIIVQGDAIISQGWNGTPKGFDNVCEEEHEGQLKTKPEVIHAEMNAIAKVAKGTHSSDGAEMFITHSPCYDCSKAIIQSGIRKVYFKDSYRDNRPIEFLKQAGVEVEQI